MNLDDDDVAVRCTLVQGLADGSFCAQARDGRLLFAQMSRSLERQCIKVREGDFVIIRLTPPKLTSGFIISKL